jgi:hypothetical protein
MGMGLVLGLVSLADHTMAAGMFDGTYAGTLRETLNNNSGYCQNINRDTRIVIKDSVINYKWGPVPLETTVGGDGSFSVDRPGMQSRGASAAISLKGRISGGNLEADVGGSQCAGHLSLKKT